MPIWISLSKNVYDHRTLIGACNPILCPIQADTQRRNAATLGTHGSFPECSPFYDHGHVEADPSWGIAAWKVPMKVAAYYDDPAIEQDWYPNARAYMEHWVTLAANNSGLLGILPIGDWGALSPAGPNGSPAFRPPSMAQFQFVNFVFGCCF